MITRERATHMIIHASDCSATSYDQRFTYYVVDMTRIPLDLPALICADCGMPLVDKDLQDIPIGD